MAFCFMFYILEYLAQSHTIPGTFLKQLKNYNKNGELFMNNKNI